MIELRMDSLYAGNMIRDLDDYELRHVRDSVDRYVYGLGVVASVRISGKRIIVSDARRPARSRQNPLDLPAREELARKISAYLNDNMPNLRFVVRVD